MSVLEPERLKRDVLDNLPEHGSSQGYQELADDLGVPEQEVRDVLSRLVDQGDVILTPDWEYRSK